MFKIHLLYSGFAKNGKLVFRQEVQGILERPGSQGQALFAEAKLPLMHWAGWGRRVSPCIFIYTCKWSLRSCFWLFKILFALWVLLRVSKGYSCPGISNSGTAVDKEWVNLNILTWSVGFCASAGCDRSLDLQEKAHTKVTLSYCHGFLLNWGLQATKEEVRFVACGK